MVVVVIHIFETFHLLPWMHWGPGASLRSHVSWTDWPLLRSAFVLRHPVDEQRMSLGDPQVVVMVVVVAILGLIILLPLSRALVYRASARAA